MDENEHKYSIYSFAYCGTDEGFQNKLITLAQMAEPEKWSFDENNPYKILRGYIFKTFEQCNKQGKIVFSEDQNFCCTNTGLLTPNGKDILMIFCKNNHPENRPWYLKNFRESSDREVMQLFRKIPSLASYTENYEDYYFHPDYQIEINTDHILDDNWDRIRSVIALPKPIVKGLLYSAVNEAEIKVKRNMRLVVPQFYKNEIMYLLPINFPISDSENVTMALAVESTGNCRYRANTIFTREMAYEKARLLMKPESNWLIE